MPPTRLEQFSVFDRALTDPEMNHFAGRVDDSASVWYEDPGVWPSYDMFVGFRIGVASLEVAGGINFRESRRQIERLALAVFARCGITPPAPEPIAEFI